MVVVTVVVDVVVGTGVVVLCAAEPSVVALTTTASAQRSHDMTHVSSINSAFFSHSPNLAKTGHNSCLSMHSLVVVRGSNVELVPVSVTVLVVLDSVVLVTSIAVEVKSIR